MKELSADSVDDYVDTLEHEVWKYTVKEPNYGKAARRMYNVFRMNGKYREAAYIRELFDEPVTALYQVAALIRTLDDAASSGDTFATDTMVAQVDGLIMSAIQALDGPEEAKMVGHLLQLRNSLQSRESHAERSDEMAGIQDAAIGAVNDVLRAGAARGPGDRRVPRGHRPPRAVTTPCPGPSHWTKRPGSAKRRSSRSRIGGHVCTPPSWSAIAIVLRGTDGWKPPAAYPLHANDASTQRIGTTSPAAGHYGSHHVHGRTKGYPRNSDRLDVLASSLLFRKFPERNRRSDEGRCAGSRDQSGWGS